MKAKYIVKFYSSKEGKVVERECESFTFSDERLYFYLTGIRDTAHSLYVRSYMVSLTEDSEHRFVFGGFQPEVKNDGTVDYTYRSVEILPLKEETTVLK